MQEGFDKKSIKKYTNVEGFVKEYGMKQGSFNVVRLAAFLIFALVTVLSSFGDETTAQWRTVILEPFNESSGITWNLDASRFATKGTDEGDFPKMAFVEAWPIAVFGYNRNNELDLKSLGLHGRFDRRGFNWIDLYPVIGGDGDDRNEPRELPIPGRLRSIDMWVWGSNFDFYIEAYFRDHGGVIHIIRLGHINYVGWRNLRANIPTSIPQSRRTLPRFAGLTFVKFRVWTQPTERVSDFRIYFNQFQLLTDMFESLYDGNELGDPDFVQELWANSN